MNKITEIMQLGKGYSSSLEKCRGNKLLLQSFTFCRNDAVTITLVSAKFPGLKSEHRKCYENTAVFFGGDPVSPLDTFLRYSPTQLS